MTKIVETKKGLMLRSGTSLFFMPTTTKNGETVMVVKDAIYSYDKSTQKFKVSFGNSITIFLSRQQTLELESWLLKQLQTTMAKAE